MSEIKTEDVIKRKLKLRNITKLTDYAITFLTILLLTVFPMYYHNYYFDILLVKYQFFCLAAIAMVAVMVISFISRLYFDHTWSNHIHLNKLSMADLGMLAFCAIAIISTLQSDYQYESFWGNEGRYSGLFLILLYGSVFFIISKRVRYSKWLVTLFLGVSTLLCLFGITDYFMLDLLGFKKNILEDQYNMFASTIGNINTYTAYVAMVMGVSAVLFAGTKNLKGFICYYFCMILSFFAIIMGLSDNAYLAIGALLAFLPFWLFKSKTGVKRYIIICTTFIYVIYAVDLINKIIPDHVLQMSGILKYVSEYNKLEYIVAAATGITLFVYVIDFIKKGDEKPYGRKLQAAWAALIVLFFVGILYILYDANLAGHGDRYGALGNYLVLNDEWGTHRGYIWRIGMESYLKLPLVHKIFGYGPDTFGLMTLSRYHEMIKKYNEYVDSAHNEYLQYFVTVGPAGFISYMMILVGSGKQMIKNAGKDPYLMAILFAVICYGAQAVVNISLPITTPVFIVLLAVGSAGSKKAEAEG